MLLRILLNLAHLDVIQSYLEANQGTDADRLEFVGLFATARGLLEAEADTAAGEPGM